MKTQMYTALHRHSMKTQMYTALQVLYDGLRVLLQLANSQRGAVSGICGNFNGEKIDDFMTPLNCVQANPEMFVSSYSVPSDRKQGKAPSSDRRPNSSSVSNNSPEDNCIPRTVFRGRPIEEEVSPNAKIQTANRRKQSHFSSRHL